MKECAFNLLTTPSFHTEPNAITTLPGLLALLARDQVDSYPALRPHQAPAWHMFLVQLAALAMHRAELSELPDTEAEWARILRGLTAEFPGDEPWCLVVEDRSKPAFMQPPVPQGVKLDTEVATPDALDLLITSRNHDLKQAIARRAAVQDWVFALVSLQTMSPYGGGKGGYPSIARIKSGASFRPFSGVAPLGLKSKSLYPRFGSHFRRDVEVLLPTRSAQLEWYSAFKNSGGYALLWTVPWNDNSPLVEGQLDIWFIEVCRRIRFCQSNETLVAYKGTSRGARIRPANTTGDVGDPWAPVSKQGEMLTLGIGKQRLDYKLIVDVFIKPEDWRTPLLAKHHPSIDTGEMCVLIIDSISHDIKGNSRGQQKRILPISGKVARSLGARRVEIYELAQKQIEDIVKFSQAIGRGLGVAASGGNEDKVDPKKTSQKEVNRLYSRSDNAKMLFDRAVDAIFFEHLWARFDAQDEGRDALQAESLRFVRQLYELAQSVFEEALPAMPCAKLFRPRAEVRARSAFHSSIRSAFPELILVRGSEETNDANS